MGADPATPDPPSLAILQDVTSSRLSHGLKHGDHLRYRRYCTRRLARLRSSCALRNGRSSAYSGTPVTPAAVRALRVHGVRPRARAGEVGRRPGRL